MQLNVHRDGALQYRAIDNGNLSPPENDFEIMAPLEISLVSITYLPLTAV